jgi:methylase of polypeptide subunit release factors
MISLEKHLQYVIEAHNAIIKPQTIQYFNQSYIIYPEVFNPILTASTTTTIKSMNRRKEIFKNKKVLDVGSGSGILGFQSIYLGSKNCLGIDINEKCIDNSIENSKRLNCKGKYSAIKSDLFANVKTDDKFDIILANLPLVDAKPKDKIEQAFYDHGLLTLIRFLSEIKYYCNENSKIFLNSASIMDNPRVVKLAYDNGLFLSEVELFDQYIFDHYVLIFTVL